VKEKVPNVLQRLYLNKTDRIVAKPWRPQSPILTLVTAELSEKHHFMATKYWFRRLVRYPYRMSRLAFLP
jgi:hypothetical protein